MMRDELLKYTDVAIPTSTAYFLFRLPPIPRSSLASLSLNLPALSSKNTLATTSSSSSQLLHAEELAR